MNLRRILIRILLKLIDNTEEYRFNDKKVNMWLAENHMDIRFNAYYNKRTLRLLQLMGSGLNEEKYRLALGQRIELVQLKKTSHQAWVLEQKRKEKRSEKNKKGNK